MIKELVQYPQTPSIEFNAPVRFFDDELFELIQDLKDTIEANNLKALSAYQINNPYSVIVVKQDDGSFLELINPRILKSSGTITTLESTTYFKDIQIEVARSKNITIMYENRDAKQCYLDASDEYAVLLQRKIDYNFGANFRQRLTSSKQDELDMKLEYGADTIINNSCPTNFKRDKILKIINILLGINLFAIITSFVISNEQILNNITSSLNYSFVAIVGLIIFYFFYAQYEGKDLMKNMGVLKLKPT
jgi:peptide deformylase